jgi:molybdopterin converting factor small subunit
MQIRVMALGVFRTVAAEFVVDIRDDACVRDVREALESRLSVESPRMLDTLARSAFAQDDMVLKDSDPLIEVDCLSILPPVAGG